MLCYRRCRGVTTLTLVLLLGGLLAGCQGNDQWAVTQDPLGADEPVLAQADLGAGDALGAALMRRPGAPAFVQVPASRARTTDIGPRREMEPLPPMTQLWLRRSVPPYMGAWFIPR